MGIQGAKVYCNFSRAFKQVHNHIESQPTAYVLKCLEKLTFLHRRQKIIIISFSLSPISVNFFRNSRHLVHKFLQAAPSGCPCITDSLRHEKTQNLLSHFAPKSVIFCRKF